MSTLSSISMGKEEATVKWRKIETFLPAQANNKALPKPIKMWFGFNGRWVDRYFLRIISGVGFIFWKLSCENNYCVAELIPWLEGSNTKHTRSWEIWELSDKRLFADYIYCSSSRIPRTNKKKKTKYQPVAVDTNIATLEQLLSDAQHSLVRSWLQFCFSLRNLQILCGWGSWHRGSIMFPLNRDQMNKITINNNGVPTLCYDRAFVPQRISHPLSWAIITNSREIHIFVEFDCNITDCNRSQRDCHALLSYINIPSSACNLQGFLLTRQNLLKDRNLILGSQQVSLALIPWSF